MTIIIRQAHIQDPASVHHHQIRDIRIEDGIIREISPQLEGSADQVLDIPDLHVSPGFMDLFAQFHDPGQEHKETLETGAEAAAAGGFTDVVLVPNTHPAVSTRAQVEYIKHRSASLPVNLHPCGSVSKNLEGKELAEMYDMQQSGAVAFTDGLKPLQHSGLLTKALLYVKPTGCPVIQMPDDISLSATGLMHEGLVSTRLGLPGKPALAEEIMIARDLALLRYTGSHLHITGLSTRKGLDMIRAAKAEGLRVSVSVTPYHCWFTDDDLQTYNSNLKVNPPVRLADDREALREGLTDGTIDAIASHHIPQHWDDKTCEFEYAGYGMNGLESVLGAVHAITGSLDSTLRLLVEGPRKVLGLSQPLIEAGQVASLSLFRPDETYVFNESMIRSRSANNAFVGKELKGRALGIIRQHHIRIASL